MRPRSAATTPKRKRDRIESDAVSFFIWFPSATRERSILPAAARGAWRAIAAVGEQRFPRWNGRCHNSARGTVRSAPVQSHGRRKHTFGGCRPVCRPLAEAEQDDRNAAAKNHVRPASSAKQAAGRNLRPSNSSSSGIFVLQTCAEGSAALTASDAVPSCSPRQSMRHPSKWRGRLRLEAPSFFRVAPHWQGAVQDGGRVRCHRHSPDRQQHVQCSVNSPISPVIRLFLGAKRLLFVQGDAIL